MRSQPGHSFIIPALLVIALFACSPSARADVDSSPEPTTSQPIAVPPASQQQGTKTPTGIAPQSVPLRRATPLPDAPLPPLPAKSGNRTELLVAPGRLLPPLLIPMLQQPPTIEDFLSGSPATSAARAMREVTGFIQQDPNDGDPVSEGTSAFFGYTPRDLYIVFICRDSSPEQLRAHLLPRDQLTDDDKIEVTLDTFHDRRRGLLFQVNPLGVQADATYAEGSSGPDFSFDTVWDSWGRRTSFGYVTMMRIPFQSLRFRAPEEGGMQLWGIVLRRWISHASESAYWPRISRQIAGRLTQDAPIEGFTTVKRGRNMQLIPYVLGQNYRRLDNRNPLAPSFDSKQAQFATGLDAKAVLHDSLVLDTTLNPDFSQVNINDPASPNQRFESFFYEQRPFFIENSSYFATPINLFYTLNIASPQFGARLSGKQGPWAVGLLAADDRSPGQTVAPGNPAYNSRAEFYIARIARDIGRFSTAGAIYTDREYKDTFNRVGGLDYRLRFHKQWTLTGQGVTSATRQAGNTLVGNSYKQILNFTGENLYFAATYNDTDKNFLDKAGFFRRPDDQEAHIHSRYTWRPGGKILLSHGPEFYVEQDWDHTALGLDSVAHFNYNLLFARNTAFTGFVDVSNDRLRPSDYSTLKINREYRSQSAGLDFSTSPVPQFTLNLSGYAGQSVNYSPTANQPPQPVDVESSDVRLDLRPNTRLDLQNRYEFDRFTDPETSLIAYDNHLVVSRWNLQMSRALAIRLTGVYRAVLPDSRFTSQQNLQDLYGDALLSYVPHPGTAVYLGYTTDAQNLDPALCTRLPDGTCNPQGTFLPRTENSLLADSRSLYLKVSYLLRF